MIPCLLSISRIALSENPKFAYCPYNWFNKSSLLSLEATALNLSLFVLLVPLEVVPDDVLLVVPVAVLFVVPVPELPELFVVVLLLDVPALTVISPIVGTVSEFTLLM